jgi:hypothetical protein
VATTFWTRPLSPGEVVAILIGAFAIAAQSVPRLGCLALRECNDGISI